MGFFDKIKQAFGIGGVKVEISAPDEVKKENGKIDGTLHFTTKTDQTVEGVRVDFLERFEYRTGQQKRVDRIKRGSVELAGFAIKANESKDVPFSVVFNFPVNTAEGTAKSLEEKGGMLGALGKMGSMVEASKQQNRMFELNANANIKGAIGSNKIKSVRLV